MIEMLTILRNNYKFKKALLVLSIVFLFLYIFSIPAFSGRSFWHYFSYGFMVLLSITSIFYFVLYVNRTEIKYRIFLLPAFALWGAIGTIFYSQNFRGYLSLILLVLSFFIFYFTFLNIGDSRIIIKTLVFAFSLFCVYFLFVYRNKLIGAIKNGDRLGSEFDNPNAIGTYMNTAIILSLYLSIMFKKKRDLFYLFPVILFLFVGYLTGSRTFIVNLVVSIYAILFIRFRKKKLIFLVIALASAVSFVILLNLPFMSFIKNQFLNTLFTLFGGSSGKIDKSSLSRTEWQLFGIILGSKNCIIGYGFYGFAKYSGIGTYTHGTFSEVFCDYGLIGLLLFYIFIVLPFILMFYSKKQDKYIIIPLFLLFIVKSFLGVFITDKDSYIIFALCYFLVNDVKSLTIFSKKAFDEINYSEFTI